MKDKLITLGIAMAIVTIVSSIAIGYLALLVALPTPLGHITAFAVPFIGSIIYIYRKLTRPPQ